MIKILFFAGLKERLKTSEMEWADCPITVRNLKSQLALTYKGAVEFESVMVAINEEYAQDEDTIECGQIVAFIPPVSGG